jgi:hypothetical protein
MIILILAISIEKWSIVVEFKALIESEVYEIALLFTLLRIFIRGELSCQKLRNTEKVEG